MRRLDSAQIVCRRLAALSVGNKLVRQLLPFGEAMHAGAFDGADMHEHVLADAVSVGRSPVEGIATCLKSKGLAIWPASPHVGDIVGM